MLHNQETRSAAAQKRPDPKMQRTHKGKVLSQTQPVDACYRTTTLVGKFLALDARVVHFLHFRIERARFLTPRTINFLIDVNCILDFDNSYL